jgi:hypothetical protein
MIDFNALKAQRGTGSLQKLTEELAKIQENRKAGDDRFWSPGIDKVGNGYAVIRFLQAAPGEDIPFVRIWDHGFQGPGGWYIENSLTTIGKDDPVSEYNSKLWNSTTDDASEERKQARAQKRRLHYISNILVVQDSANPDNDGKVFLFKYGKKVFAKLTEAMEPQFPDDLPFNPFDFWSGANFKLKIRKVEGYRNYDRSEFAEPSPVAATDKDIEAIWRSEHPLQPFLDPSNFKTYEELQKKLARVLSGATASQRKPEDDTPWIEDRKETASKEIKSLPPKRQTTVIEDDDDESALAYFASLAEKG